MSTLHKIYKYWGNPIELSVKFLNPDFVFVHCRISVATVLYAQPELKISTTEITVCSSLTDLSKNVARAVGRVNHQTGGWLLEWASGVDRDLREVLIPLRIQRSRKLGVLFEEPIGPTPF